MPTTPLPAAVTEMLRQPNPAVIATVRPDGSPVSVPTWYLEDGGRILVNMDAERRRLAYLRQDPRVSLTVLDSDDWMTHVSLQGRMERIEDDTNLSGIDRLALHYTGRPYRVRTRPRVNGWIAIERWHAWGRLKAAA